MWAKLKIYLTFCPSWLDGYEAQRHPDGAGITLAGALNAVLDADHGEPLRLPAVRLSYTRIF